MEQLLDNCKLAWHVKENRDFFITHSNSCLSCVLRLSIAKLIFPSVKILSMLLFQASIPEIMHTGTERIISFIFVMHY